MKTTAVYFSATFTTQKVVEHIARQLSDDISICDITLSQELSEVELGEEELLVVGIPVYAGRVPALAVERIRRFKGNGARAVVVAVYGNRDYDDALLELADIVSDNGFSVISAGAFIAQHSIFPKVGGGRPDAADYAVMDEFAKETKRLLEMDRSRLLPVHLKGNRPYKVPGSIPIFPSAGKGCNECGKCARQCPTGAIDPEHPKGVDEEKCIKCGRCIAVCPTQSRGYSGMKYMMASLKFNTSYQTRREPELFFVRYN